MTLDLDRAPAAEAARFVATLAYDDLDAETIRLAERCFIDTVGVTLAGAKEPSSENAASIAREEGTGSATLIGHDDLATTTAAAFANATAAHALDYDDMSWGMDGHPSVTLVPSILAAAELSDVGGRRALTAFVAGYEVECYLAAAIKPGHYERGWHSTATMGAFGATAAAATVLDLSVDATRHALNVAASTPAGLKRNFGSMTKPMHVGQAVRSGLTAARLAKRGFTADRDAIGGAGGFLDLYSDDDGPDLSALPDFGQAMEEHGIHVKKYPCCYFTHTTIASIIDIVTEHDLDPAAIESIDVGISPGAADALAHDKPETPLQAKFSLPYTAARAGVYRKVGLAAFTDDAVADGDVRSLQDRVDYETDGSIGYDEPTATVVVTTTDGSVFDRTCEQPPGTHDNPLTDEELRRKFLQCATRVMAEDHAESIYARFDDLRDEPSVAALTSDL